MNQKAVISSAFGIIVTLVIATGVGGYIYSQSLIPDEDETAPILYSHESTQTPSPTSQSTIPADWKTYRNEKYGYAITVPADVHGFEDAGGMVIPLDPYYQGMMLGGSNWSIGVLVLEKRDEVNPNEYVGMAKNGYWFNWYVKNYIIPTAFPPYVLPPSEYHHRVVKIGDLEATEFFIPTKDLGDKIRKGKYFYLFESDNTIIGISFNEDNTVARQILSTFKFTK